VTVIDGVIVKDLVTHSDERGFFREIIRSGEGADRGAFGQISHSLVNLGVIKAWHAHKVQSQWNYVVNGLLKVVLYDNRSDSPTFKNRMELFIGDDELARAYYFPAGVLHGYKCLKGPMNIIYVTSDIYDLTDEVRIAHDDRSIGYDWLNVPVVRQG